MADTTYVAPSLPPRCRSILRSKSASDVSTTSNDSKSSSITFAPLPEITARKRRNTRPIGIATRAEMLHKSRRHYVSQLCDDHDELPPEEEVEIPLPDIGKLIKGLWRSVSRGHGKDKSVRTELSGSTDENITSPVVVEDDRDGKGGPWMEPVAWTSLDTCPPSLLGDTTKLEPPQDAANTIEIGSLLDKCDRNRTEAHEYQSSLQGPKGLAPQ